MIELLEVHGNQTADHQREIWRASQLPAKSMRAVVNAVGSEEAQTICQPWMQPLENFFGMLSPNTRVGDLVQQLDENTMRCVLTCAAFLSTGEPDEVQDLLDCIDELRREVEDLDLPDDLRAFVKDRLQDIEAAVGDYCHGVGDSSEIVEVCWRTQEKIQEVAADKRPTKTIKNGLAVLGKLVVVSNAAASLWEKAEPKVKALAEHVTKLLPPGGA
ncbi:MAG: hypothetical protein OXG81_02735 [Acidobacteria bacterium]|nr:hypothetical protein [Acidobacteriota bacterium]